MQRLLTKIKKFKETRDSRYIYRKELDEACFQHDTAYGDFKDFPRRPASDKVLHNKTFNMDKNPKHDDIKEVLLRWFNNFLIKKLLMLILLLHAHFQRLYGQRPWLSGAVKNEIMSNQQLAQKIHQPVIRKFEKQKEYTYLL